MKQLLELPDYVVVRGISLVKERHDVRVEVAAQEAQALPVHTFLDFAPDFRLRIVDVESICRLRPCCDSDGFFMSQPLSVLQAETGSTSPEPSTR